jgi:hypothetical protein
LTDWLTFSVITARMTIVVRLLVLGFALALLGVSGSARAQELLLNRSFETPVTTANGNNFYATIPNWSIINVTPAQASPANVIRPFAGYAGNPTAPPAGGGVQYFDVNSAAGTLQQIVTIPSQGMVDLSGWFSVRDNPQALSGLTINIRNAGGTIIGTASTSFLASDPIGLWKQVTSANLPVSAGTYTFEVVMADPSNFDLASLVFKPAITVGKSNAAYSDPVNGLVNPKQIPGGITEYTISATTPSSYSVMSNTIVVADPTPANTELIVADIGGAGSGPAAFAPGVSGLTYSFASLASAADDIEFSSDGGTSWTYAPVANGNGADPAVTNVRMRPKGAMAANATLTFKLRYRVK